MPTDPTRTMDEANPSQCSTGEFSLPEGTGEYTADGAAPPPSESSPPGGATAASVSDTAPPRPALEGTMDISAPAPPSASSPSSGGSRVFVTGGGATAASLSYPGRPARPPIEGTVDLPASQAGAVPDGTFAYEPGTPGAPAAGGNGDFVVSGTEVHEASQSGRPVDPADAPTPAPVEGSTAPAGKAFSDGPRYSLKKVHARGGMGEVWAAEDVNIGRVVALKKMRKQMRGKEDQFFWEGQITGLLEHPGIVPVHELGIDDKGEPYYVMKFVHGKTLLQEIDAFHAAPENPNREVERLRLLQVFQAMCLTMGYAHSRGIIHRDIKPENVMIGEYGETLVLDWGLAKQVGADEHEEKGGSVKRLSLTGETAQTLAGSIKGTPWYMAPEVAAGDLNKVDQLSDVYLLGATLYHLLTGKLPRTGKTIPELIAAAHKPPVAPRTADPTIPKPLEAICLKAMAVDRGARYATAKALADDLQSYLAGEPVTAYRETFMERAWRWARRHRKAIARVAAAAVVLTAAGIGYAKYEDIQAKRAAERVQHARELEAAEADRVAAQKQADELARRQKAAADLKQYRKLAEEMRFLAANTHPAAANSPFFNPRAGLEKGEQALAVAAPWGSNLEDFPLDAERPGLAADLYDLLLLMAQIRVQAAGSAGDPDVLPLLDRAAGLRPPTRSYHRLRGQGLAAAGRPTDAAPELKLADDPKTPLTAADHFLLGELARSPLTRPENLRDRTGKFRPDRAALEAAIAEFRLALRDEPNHYWANMQLGRGLMGLDRLDEAVQALGACVALKPDSPWGYSARGVALTTLKRYDDAAADMEKALALYPESRQLRMNRGSLAWQRGNRDAALKDFDAALDGKPDEQIPEAAFSKAMIYGELGDLEKALVAADRALATKTPVRTAYMFRAQIHFRQGHDPEGIDDLNSFLAGGDPKFDPKSAKAAGQRGHRLRLLAEDLPPGVDKQRAEMRRLARAELKDAVARGGGTPTVLEDLGMIQQRLGQPAEAIKAYSEAIDKLPAGKEANADRVRLLVTRGWAILDFEKPDLALSRADFDAALKIKPDNAEAHTGLGYVEACLKTGPVARREAQVAVLYGSGDYLILHNVACVFAKLSEVETGSAREFEDLALDYLKRAVELWRRDRTGPNELAQIKAEGAFGEKLRKRSEFKDLFIEPKP